MTVAPRIHAIDGLRGIAVMGIVAMNITAFAMPFAAYDNPAAYGAMRPADLLLWAVNLVLVDGKMRAIFSALFGASLLIVSDRAAAAGRSPARVHYARMAWLLVFGLAHACLIWDGDILTLYALVGLLAFPLRRLAIERQLVLAGLLFVFGAAALALHYQALDALGAAAGRPGASPADVAAWRGVLDQIGRPSSPALAADLALHRGPWFDLARTRIAIEPASIFQQMLFDGPETLALMLLGMAGFRIGFLAGRWPAGRMRRIAAWAYALGLPPMAGMAWFLVRAGFPPLETSMLVNLAAMPLRWLIAIGHVALIVSWFARGPSPLKARIAAIGRTALSNYLGTSLILAGLFYGLAFYGRLERWMLAPVMASLWIGMLAWSRPWLTRFAYGPFEWLWRSLARGKMQKGRIGIAS